MRDQSEKSNFSERKKNKSEKQRNFEEIATNSLEENLNFFLIKKIHTKLSNLLSHTPKIKKFSISRIENLPFTISQGHSLILVSESVSCSKIIHKNIPISLANNLKRE